MSWGSNNKGRILLADDDRAFRLATRGFLRQQGFDCEVAPDATVATELLRRSEFDLLIADINMPGNAGLQFIEKLPQVAAGLPVILLTGHPTLQTASRSVRLQVAAYLVKPCDPDELLTVAQEAIDSHRAASAHRARLESWTRELAQLEEVLQRAQADASGPAANVSLQTTTQNLLAVLVDLKQLADGLVRRKDRVSASPSVALHQAIRETIRVLENSETVLQIKGTRGIASAAGDSAANDSRRRIHGAVTCDDGVSPGWPDECEGPLRFQRRSPGAPPLSPAQ